ncbi:response regulator transcription factor [Puteibacter caeruleilacunae]|nr:response regulator transcription factor [Puteibacter caeruleilacunae]
MTIKCIVVDDEIHARKVLEKYISDISHLELVKSCKNALEAMEALRNYDIEAMFLDINMPKLTGLNLLESIKNPPAVVITTAYREYAVDAFDLDVVDYLHKPIPFPRFMRAVSKIEDKLAVRATQKHVVQETITASPAPSFIFVRADKKTIKLNYGDILYMEGLGDYVQIYCKEKKVVTKMKIKDLEELLPENQFPRVHRSYIVALAAIDTIEGNLIRIGNKQIPIGQIYKQSFMSLINNYMT